MSMSKSKRDTVDKLVVFLAKRDGIDKVVKTFQYVSKLAQWGMAGEGASRAKRWEVAAGLGRKAFRTGRFLSGFNALRRSPGATPSRRLLAVLANAGEMVYFFFDHFLWLARIGTIDPALARRLSFVSAFGEAFGYVFFMILDILAITCTDQPDKPNTLMTLMALAANLADLLIALADIHPNPFCNHHLTLAISGLVSAWAGWYRNWPT